MTDAVDYRRGPSIRNRWLYARTVAEAYEGFCPACEVNLVVYGPYVAGHVDHWFGRGANGLRQMWLVCSSCNFGMKRADERLRRASAFNSFQEALDATLAAEAEEVG